MVKLRRHVRKRGLRICNTYSDELLVCIVATSTYSVSFCTAYDLAEWLLVSRRPGLLKLMLFRDHEKYKIPMVTPLRD